MSYCTKCGKESKPGSLFCTGCGAPMPQKETLNTPSPQDIQDSQDIQKTQEIEDVQDIQNAQDTQNTQKIQNARDTQDIQSSPRDPLETIPQTSPKPVKYRKPIAFRIIASVLIVVLTISATIRLSSVPPETGIRDVATSQTSSSLLYTKADYAAASTERAKVSPSNHMINIGSLKVDFNPWNLKNDDEIIMRALPEKKDSSTKTAILGYDLSLKSGQSTFYTPVAVTIPCTAKDDEDGSIVMLDEENNTWEYMPFELSEGGKSYLAYMPHFSVIGEKKTNKYIGVENEVRDTKGDLTTQGNLYQYSTVHALDGSLIPLAKREVFISDDKFQSLFYHGVDREKLLNILKSANLAPEDAMTFGLGTLCNAESTGDAAILFGKLDKAFSAAGKLRLSGTMATLGVLLTAGRIAYQSQKGGEFGAILKDNASSIVQGILGSLSFGAAYVGATAASAVFATLSVAVFISSLTFGFFTGTSQYESYQEEAYNYFMKNQKLMFNRNTLQVGLTGDFELGIDGGGFAEALKLIYDKHTTSPKDLDKAVSDLYNGFASVFWTELSEEKRAQWAQEVYLYESRVYEYPVSEIIKWKEPSEEKRNEYIQKVFARIATETKPILQSLAFASLANMSKDLRRFFIFEVEPYLNQKLTFSVKDSNLKKGETFDLSPYAKHDIYFEDRTAPLFAPRFLNTEMYTDELFTPRPRKDSDVVYECTMYHYIMMGCPTEMVFAGDPSNNLPEVTIQFEVDESEIVLTISEDEIKVPFKSFNIPKDARSRSSFYHSFVETVLPYPERITITPIGNGKYRFVIQEVNYEYINEKEKVAANSLKSAHEHAEESVFEGIFNNKREGIFELVSGGNISIKEVSGDGRESYYNTSNTKCTLNIKPDINYKGEDFEDSYTLLYRLDYDLEEKSNPPRSSDEKRHIKGKTMRDYVKVYKD